MTLEHSSHFHRVNTTNSYKVVFDQVKEYIGSNMEHDVLLLDDFCILRGHSRRSVQRALSWHNTSWSKLLVTERMKKASDLLRTTKRPIKNVARSVGYRSHEAFERAFARHCGITPAHYRKVTPHE